MLLLATYSEGDFHPFGKFPARFNVLFAYAVHNGKNNVAPTLTAQRGKFYKGVKRLFAENAFAMLLILVGGAFVEGNVYGVATVTKMSVTSRLCIGFACPLVFMRVFLSLQCR